MTSGDGHGPTGGRERIQKHVVTAVLAAVLLFWSLVLIRLQQNFFASDGGTGTVALVISIMVSLLAWVSTVVALTRCLRGKTCTGKFRR